MDLEKLLQEEKERYIEQEMLFYALVDAFGPKRFRGLRPTLDEQWIEEHLTACRDYFEKHGTKFGEGSPWIEAWRNKYG